MADNSNLNRAHAAKDDEWYTCAADADGIVSRYAADLRGRRVLCPCDGERSAFYISLRVRYKELGLGALIATHRAPGGISYGIYYDGARETRRALDGDGDILGPRFAAFCAANGIDLIMTNPPFSIEGRFIEELDGIGMDYVLMAPYLIGIKKAVFNIIRDRRAYMERLPSQRFLRPDGSVAALGNVDIIATIGAQRGRALPAEGASVATLRRIDGPDDIVNIDSISDLPRGYAGRVCASGRILEYDLSGYDIIGLIHQPTIGGVRKFTRIIIQRRI